MNKPLLLGLAIMASTIACNATTQPAVPEGWQQTPVRAEVSPKFFTEQAGGQTLLGMAGQGNEAVNGYWHTTMPAAAGKYFRLSAQYLPKDIATPNRSVLARVIWLDEDGKKLVREGEYPYTTLKCDKDGYFTVSGVYLTPEKTAKAKIELHFRWEAKGTVLWRNVELKETTAPAPRKVRLGTVSRYPRGTKTAENNLKLFEQDIDEAGKQKADIVCLGEVINFCGTYKQFIEMAEPIPGPSTKSLGEMAKRNKLYIVAGLCEMDGKTMYNTAVLIDREGKVAGKYRKTTIPMGEADAGIAPGTELPVFDTDFGRIGLMICWDLTFPEVARGLSAKGAEVLLMPIWGGMGELAVARAIENQVYVVASGYDLKSAVYDLTGKTLVQAKEDPKVKAEVLVTEVDLSKKVTFPWTGDLRSRLCREEPDLKDQAARP